MIQVNDNFSDFVFLGSLFVQVVGEVKVGKTSILRRYTKDIFTNDNKATVMRPFSILIWDLCFSCWFDMLICSDWCWFWSESHSTGSTHNSTITIVGYCRTRTIHTNDSCLLSWRECCRCCLRYHKVRPSSHIFSVTTIEKILHKSHSQSIEEKQEQWQIWLSIVCVCVDVFVKRANIWSCEALEGRYRQESEASKWEADSCDPTRQQSMSNFKFLFFTCFLLSLV